MSGCGGVSVVSRPGRVLGHPYSGTWVLRMISSSMCVSSIIESPLTGETRVNNTRVRCLLVE